jgi:hypothetical protein
LAIARCANETTAIDVDIPVVDVQELAKGYNAPESMISEENLDCYYQLPSLFFSTPSKFVGRITSLICVAKVLKNLYIRGAYDLFDPSVLATFAALYWVLSLLTYNIMLPTGNSNICHVCHDFFRIIN